MEALLQALEASDAATLVRAIEEARAFLARDPGAIAGAVARHAGHERAKVRQAVAEVAVHLPDEAYETVIGRLLQDSNAYVKRAATRSYDERSRRERRERECEERSGEILELRERIGGVYGAVALKMADRVADRALGEFVERLLHEIVKVATPLKGAMADVRAGARGATTGGDRQRLAARADEAHGMVELLIGIAQSARAQMGEAEPSFREVNVRALVDEQVALLRQRIGEARLGRLRVGIDVDGALTVEGDRVRLAQAISNLLQNAVEAYPADGAGEIVIGVRAESRKVDALIAVAIEDRGGGLQSGMVGHIGEAFVSTKGGGRGLGLLNVRRTVEVAHGGTLQVDSECGVGTRMTVVLPRKQAVRGGDV